jgi:heterotetrameric sarcosine oxidase delta subunit
MPSSLPGGEAHIVRPPEPQAASDQQWGEYLYFRKNVKGMQLERWFHAYGCRRWFNVARDSVTHEIRCGVPDGRAAAGKRRVNGQSFRLATGGAIDRKPVARVHVQRAANITDTPAIRSPRRCWRTACAWWHAASSITARAGIVSAGPEEPNALVRVGGGASVLPNVPATMVEVWNGMQAASINCWPSVEFDLGAVSNFASALLPAGFYYKTFMWPDRGWMWYERFIRRAAGLGRTPDAPDPDRYDKRNEHCDVLVIGGGPAGLALRSPRGARARAWCW